MPPHAVWEMVHCRPVYADLGPHAVLAGVLRGDLRPEFDPGCLPPLEALARDCWAQDPRCAPGTVCLGSGGCF